MKLRWSGSGLCEYNPRQPNAISSPRIARKASLNGKIKLTQYRLTLGEIVSWYRSKQRFLEGSRISLVEIKQRDDGPKPAAVADFDGPNTMGRINGWVSGEFDFEVIRGSDGKDIFWRHVDVSAVDELETAYADFLLKMQAST